MQRREARALRRARGATTLAVDVAADGVRLPLSRQRLRRLAQDVLRRESVRHAILSFAFVDTKTMVSLNRRVFGHRRPTDVITLSFRSPNDRAPVVADVYVAPEVVRRNADAAGVAAREELARVVVHGVLHALGMTHPEGDRRERSAMWRRQERLLATAKRDGLW